MSIRKLTEVLFNLFKLSYKRDTFSCTMDQHYYSIFVRKNKEIFLKYLFSSSLLFFKKRGII